MVDQTNHYYAKFSHYTSRKVRGSNSCQKFKRYGFCKVVSSFFVKYNVRAQQDQDSTNYKVFYTGWVHYLNEYSTVSVSYSLV